MIDPEVLLQGYRLGVFPMAMEDGEIEWFSPNPRAILPLKEFHVPHTLERIARKKIFEIRVNVSRNSRSSASLGFDPRPSRPYSMKCSNSHW